jgi:hypothetical protein
VAGSGGGRKEIAPIVNRKEVKQPVIVVAIQRIACKLSMVHTSVLLKDLP